MIYVIIILISFDGIFVLKFIWGEVFFKLLNNKVERIILNGLFFLSNVMVILLNFIFVNEDIVVIFWNVFNFFIVLLIFVNVLVIVMENIILWEIFIFVYWEVCWLNFIDFNL